MREILFRGKRIDNGEWIEGSLVISHYNDAGKHRERYVIEDCYYGLDDEGFFNYQSGAEEDIDPSTVGQYTGLKDVNGKRIFEGDIVYSEDTFFSIAWIDSWYGFAALMAGTMDRFSIEELELSGIKVIGNIYDNPDLLEEAENDYPMQ